MTLKHISQSETTAAFFDLDGTLIHCESQFRFLLWCLKRRMIRQDRSLSVAAQYAAFLLGFTSNDIRLRQAGYSLFAGMTTDALALQAREFFEGVLRYEFNPSVIACLEKHLEDGHIVVLVTSAVETLAVPVAEQCKFHHVLATRLIESGGVLTGGFEKPPMFGEAKRTSVEEFCKNQSIDPRVCFAYADSHSDLPLLELVGNPVAVNPSRKLLRVSMQRGWPVMRTSQSDPSSSYSRSTNLCRH